LNQHFTGEEMQLNNNQVEIWLISYLGNIN
jgi:hypothetical protein